MGSLSRSGAQSCAAGLEPHSTSVQPNFTVSPPAFAVAGMLLIAPATADTFVTELPLEDAGSQRLLYVARANPRAALVMFPGGTGMVEIGNDGSIRRMDETFLLRTLPLWLGQGFAVAVLSPPNGMSLFGYRLPRPMLRRSGRRSISSTAAPTSRSGLRGYDDSRDLIAETGAAADCGGRALAGAHKLIRQFPAR